MRNVFRRHLMSASVLAVSAVFASPALAQATPQTQSTTPPAEEADTNDTIVVTGSILRANPNDTSSPVSRIEADQLDRRGVSTIQDAIQSIASNNGPALTNSFTANGAFASGASAISLRGLSTNSTLVLFDGLRAAYYPLADDGARNFVDLNTIPDDIVDHIDVLRDGASSTYGADAIAGVVNIVTKREVKGINGRLEAGISDRGDAAQYRASLTAGFGDIADQGFNAYLSGFYYSSNSLKNRDRGFPYNTDDHRTLCFQGTCGPNTVVNGVGGDGSFALSTAANFIVRPYDATNTTAQGPNRQLGAGCGVGTPYTLTADQAAANPNSPGTVCQYDYTNLYGVITPNIERFGVSGHVTAKLTDSIEAYGEVNFLQTSTGYSGVPAVVRGAAPTGILFPQFSTADGGANRAPGSGVLTLPVFVCPERINCATSANRRLNPNNPFAAQNQVARLIGRDVGSVTSNQTRNRVYRAAFGVKGDISDKWSFNVGGTAMHTDLKRTTDGYVFIQRLLDVVADGTYNFVNPAATPQSVQDYLTPPSIINSSSDLYQIQGTVNGALAELPGGPLQVGVGASFFYEAVDAPSGNPDSNGPTQRYFTLNAFGTSGNRTVSSVFGEIDAPIFDQLGLNASGRYDKYSSGQSAFSPKVGIKLMPIRQITLRGTYSRGFRIPSFGEANALPTTGYVTNNSSLFNDAFLSQYGCTVATFNVCPTYIRGGSYGQTTLASPNLAPEKSRSFTGGVKFDPVRNVTLSVDYYNIRKTGAITQPSNAPALLAYYQGQATPAGYNVIADAPDPNFPNAKPRVAFVQSQLINANTVKVSGLDFLAEGRFRVADKFTWTTSAEASLILNLSTDFPDGTSERYDGTLGNFNLTAGSGTPKWRGSWQNTFDFGQYILSGTVNYFGGYDLSAMDQGTGYKDCGLSDGSVPCRVKANITLDLNMQVKVNDKFTLYGTVNNVLDRMPPIDPVTYGAVYYNPVQGGNNILGRYIKVGVKYGL